MRTALSYLRLFVQPIVAAIAVALLVRATCFRLFSIPSASMTPTLEPGDHVVVAAYGGPFATPAPAVGDVVVFRRDDGRYFIKRIVGAPGDWLEARGGRLLRNGHTVAEPYLADGARTEGLAAEIVAGDLYWVMGDNRGDSIDSRSFGPIRREQIYGKAQAIVWSSQDEPAHADSMTTAKGQAFRWSRLLSSVE